jgi:hypothetical protein
MFFSLFILLSFGQKNNCNSCSCFRNTNSTWKIELDSNGREYLIEGGKSKTNNSLRQQILALNAGSIIKIKYLYTRHNTVFF